MVEAYHTQDHYPSPDRPEQQGVIHDKTMSSVNGAAPTLDLADLLCGPAGNRSGLRRIDDRWVGRCPLPECASRLPSFAVWPDTDAWRCFTCMRGGDATELERLVGHALVAKARGK